MKKEPETEIFGDYTIRRAESPDAREIIQCMQSVMDERIYLVSEYYFYTERGEQERLRNPDDLTLVAVYNGGIVAVLTIQRGMYRKTRHTASLGIAIRKNHRNKGLGTKMINTSVKWCRDSGITKLNLEVFSSNENAIRLYRNLGFVVEGIRKNHFYIDGKYVDDVFMTIDLLPSMDGPTGSGDS